MAKPKKAADPLEQFNIALEKLLDYRNELQAVAEDHYENAEAVEAEISDITKALKTVPDRT